MRRLAFAPLAFVLAALSPVTPATAAPSELDVARDVLAKHAVSVDLAHAATTTLSDGAKVVAFTQSIGGVPVYQRGAKVLIEKDGRTTQLSSRLEERAPRTLTPTLAAANAVAIAGKLGVPANRFGARLMVLPTGGEPTLVYAVVGDVPGLPTRPVVLLDAHTGDVVMRWDAAVSLKKAKVYKDNPIKTPDLTEVTLTNDETKEGLQNSLVVGKNCIDKKTTRDLDFGGTSITVHTCELIPTVTPDASGDYVSIAPEGDTAPEDKYAELSMFYNTMRAYDHVHAIGFPADKDVSINAVANLRVPQGFMGFDLKKLGDPNLPLQGFDNAFFAEEDPTLSVAFGLSGDTMWFGQGTKIDFGYDGDVVYHEFGHFVVSRTIKLGGGFWQDKYGLSASPGALNESLADINSFFVSDDPELGEYSSKGLGGTPGKGLRTGLNKFTLPNDITGEVHQDSEPHTAAMWEVYGGLDATKREAFQKAHMKMLLTAPTGNLGFDDMAELEIKAQSDALGADVGNALRAAFEKRGIKKNEPRVRPWTGSAISSVVPLLGIHAPGKSEMASKGDVAPGLFQIAWDMPSTGAQKVTVTFKVLASRNMGGGFGGGGSSPFKPVVLAKIGDPITFTYGPTKSDATATLPCTVASSVATCTGDLNVPAGTAKVHFMIGNTGNDGGDYDNVKITSEGGTPPAPDAGTSDDAGTTPAADAPTDDGTVKSGCGCELPGGARGEAGAGFALAGLALAIVSRRRR